MATKDVLYELRTRNGLSQEELAEKVYVTRQAVSRWEQGETTPNTETLKLLSALFGVTINTLLDTPPRSVCHCCGMPLDENNYGKNADGTPNPHYCKWCYADGAFTLDFWQRYSELGGEEGFECFKQQLINEFNALHIDGMPPVESLNVLSGHFINMEYVLPNGQKVKFLNDHLTYLGNQLECVYGEGRCFGIAANMQFLLVCSYEVDGENPELILYKQR